MAGAERIRGVSVHVFVDVAHFDVAHQESDTFCQTYTNPHLPAIAKARRNQNSEAAEQSNASRLEILSKGSVEGPARLACELGVDVRLVAPHRLEPLPHLLALLGNQGRLLPEHC